MHAAGGVVAAGSILCHVFAALQRKQTFCMSEPGAAVHCVR